MKKEENENIKDVLREDVEKELIFVGFYICFSPLKRDTAK
jgi:hypothetical protein